MRYLRRLVALVVVGTAGAFPVVPLGVVWGAEPAAVRARVTPRSYQVRYRPLGDAAELVSGVLSPEGSITLQPRLRTLVVQDTAPVLDQVTTLLESFDLPLRNVEVTVSLFLGTERGEEERGRSSTQGVFSREIRGVSETLSDFTKWTSYEMLGSRAVIATEGHRASATLSDDYRVAFEVDSIQRPTAQAPLERVRFKSFSLQRLTRTPEGDERAVDLYSTGIVLDAGRLLMVGAAKNPESKKALFLTVKAEPE